MAFGDQNLYGQRPGVQAPKQPPPTYGVGLKPAAFQYGRDDQGPGPKPLPASTTPAGGSYKPLVGGNATPNGPYPASAPAAKPMAPVSSDQSHADSMNNWYSQQGYGPGTSDRQVQQAKTERTISANRGWLAQPGVQGPYPVKTAAPVPPPPQPGLGMAPRAMAPGQPQGPAPDPVRQMMVDQLRYHYQMSKELRNGGTDPTTGRSSADFGNAAMEHAAAISRYDANRAGIQGSNPAFAAEAMAKASPQAQAFTLAATGHDPRLVSSINAAQGQVAPIDASNYMERSAQDPNLTGPAGYLNSDAAIHEKAAMFAGLPGIQNRMDPRRQLFDAYMARRKSEPGFDQELGGYNPLDPNGAALHSNMLTSFLNTAGNAVGLGTRDSDTQLRNQKFARDMAALGYAPGQIGVQN